MNRKKIQWMPFVACLVLAAPATAHAVWAHRPACDSETDSATERKTEIDACIAKIDGVDTATSKELPCTAELKALENAQASLRQCIERQLWWKKNSEIKK